MQYAVALRNRGFGFLQGRFDTPVGQQGQPRQRFFEAVDARQVTPGDQGHTLVAVGAQSGHEIVAVDIRRRVDFQWLRGVQAPGFGQRFEPIAVRVAPLRKKGAGGRDTRQGLVDG